MAVAATDGDVANDIAHIVHCSDCPDHRSKIKVHYDQTHDLSWVIILIVILITVSELINGEVYNFLLM